MDSQATMTGHVFISYAREDQAYIRKLADSLRRRGLEVWMDDRIDFGDRWWQTIVQAIDASAAFVVVMTPTAEKSEWVEREVLVALDEGKPIFPLLLRGRRFPLLVTTQYADVTDGRMPPDDFYERLEREVRAPSEGEVIPVARLAPEPTVGKDRGWSWERLRLPLALVGLVALVLLVGVVARGLIGGGEEPTPIPTPPVTGAVEELMPTQTATEIISVAPSETPTETSGDWVVVVGSDASLGDAEWEADKARQQGYNPVIYLRDNWYVTTVGPFSTKEEAESAKTAAQATIRESAREVYLNNWCPQPVVRNGYFECDAKPGPSATTSVLTIDRSQPSSSASLHDTWTRPINGMEMVYTPGGAFEMGSTDGDADERPVHTVTLEGFWIDRTEVTNVQYARCVADGTCGPPSETDSATQGSYYGDSRSDDYPVIYVSWHDAETYCHWSGGRLPTEAEWEYAARGPDGHIYPWGDDAPNDALLNYEENVGDTTQVGAYPDGATWVGAMDMAGNVWEWVSDWYAGDYYASSPALAPKGPETGNLKVLRGGSWFNDEAYVRAATRSSDLPENRIYDVGFRCVVGAGD